MHQSVARATLRAPQSRQGFCGGTSSLAQATCMIPSSSGPTNDKHHRASVTDHRVAARFLLLRTQLKQKTTEAKAVAMSASDKFRVLCLHGYGQNGETLRGRIAAFRRAFKSSVEFVCVDGPLPSEPVSQEETDKSEQDDAQQQGLSWFNFQRNEGGVGYTLSLVDESIAYIANICREQGPFDGILGFSQGGTIASLVLQRQHEKPEDFPFLFSFGIFIAAPQPGDPRIGNPDLKLAIPSLHVIGETDAVVDPERSKMVAQGFVAPQIFLHAGGHYIPTSKEPKDAFRDFFKQLKELHGKQ